ncbi:MAG: MarR family transcriptional regulator [Nitrososphaerota archaeon]|nr:MarR family transcriptional regulator [Nitrososphaerota archaeon]
MNRNQLQTLLALIDGPRSRVADIAHMLGLSPRMARRIVDSLADKGMVSVSRDGVSLAATSKAAALVRISTRLDVSKLLLDSGEPILPYLSEPRSLEELEKASGLSTATLYRTLNRMMETGAVVVKDGRYSIGGDLDVVLFARMVGDDMASANRYRTEQTVFRRGRDAIKKVARGGSAQGSPTAFSVFGRFGMQLRPEADYYVSPGRSISAEDALVHSLAVSHNRLERTHSAVFYALNRGKLDLGKVRKLAEGFGVGRLWVNLEMYVRGLTVPGDLFLPWNEFCDRCSLYGLEAEALLPPPAYPHLFVALGRALGRPLSVYLLGGENMRIKKMKQATKDVDLVVADGRDYDRLSEALARIGYGRLTKSEMGPADTKLMPSGIFVREGMPRVDVFTRMVAGKLRLVDQMVRRSEAIDQGNLRLRLLSNEDVFLLKCVTDREADDVDMMEILRVARDFDWTYLLEVLYEEERVTGRHFCFDTLQSLDFVQTTMSIKIPIFRRLLNHATDRAILRVLRNGGWMGVKEISDGIGEIREVEVRNRLAALVRTRRVKKKKVKNGVSFSGTALP